MDYNMEDAVLLTDDDTIFIDNGRTISDKELLAGDMSPEARGEEIP